MANYGNQKLRLLYLKRILQEQTDENHALGIAEITAELARYGIKVERKTLYDDFEALRLFGVDVELRRGAKYSYYIANRTFELPELKLLVDAVQSSKFITRKKSDELIKKVENLASIPQARLLQRQVYVANRIKAMNESIYYNVDTIHAAISNGKRIRFKYFSWAISFSGSERVKRQFRRNGELYTVSPWALMWDDENYYMIAFDSDANMLKHYRVDRMSGIEETDEIRDGAEQFDNYDMATYSSGMFGMFGGDEADVTLRFSNSLIGVVIDRFGRDIFIHQDGEDHFTMRARIAVSPKFLGWLFGFGCDVEILSPPKVIEMYNSRAKEIVEKYSSKSGK